MRPVRPGIRSRSSRATSMSGSISITPDKNMGRASIEGWLSLDAAKKLLVDGRAGLRHAEEAGAHARVPSGAARPHGVGGDSATSCAPFSRGTSVAKLEGSDPQLRDEYVVYTAHWDHLGMGAPVNGDKIYNGALDNASGVAAGARDRPRVHQRSSRGRNDRCCS